MLIEDALVLSLLLTDSRLLLDDAELLALDGLELTRLPPTTKTVLCVIISHIT